MEKISKIAKKFDGVVKVLYKICVVVGILCGVFLVGTPFFPMDYFEDMASSVSIGSFEFGFVSGYLPDLDYLKWYLICMFALCVIFSVYACFILQTIRKILKPMVFERPFANCVSKNIRKLSWIILVGEGALQVVDYVTEMILYRTFDFSNLFLNDTIVSCNVDYVFDGSFVVIFGIIYLLSYVFQYGEELQIQSDETL